MANLKTTYMGINLKNPIIVGANNLVTDPKKAKSMEEAGAAALVYKSLFEEQIQLESFEMDMQMEAYNERNAEMTKLFPDAHHAGPKEYLLNLKNIKGAVSIPVFGSLNCVNNETWVSWAKQIEETGVDGIELNFYHVPKDFDTTEEEIVSKQVKTVKDVVAALSIPVAVKLSPFYANPLYVIKKLNDAGAKSVVLFNGLFQPDIDIMKEKLVYKYKFSNAEDSRLPLRYTGLLYDNIEANICSSRGIYTGEDAAKMLLAGADTIQIVSCIYKNGVDAIGSMIKELDTWMVDKKYTALSDFRGKLAKKNIRSPFAYRRAQYIDILMRSDNIADEHILH